MNRLFSEAIKLKDGILHNLEYHQMRVDRTLRQFYGTVIDLSVLHEMIPGNKKTGFYKCRVVYGSRIDSVEFIPYSFRKVEKVGIIEDNNIEYGYKYADRSRLNKLLEASGCDDIIIVKNRLITDSFSANLVFQSASGLYTPESSLLQGTKRQYLLEKGIIRKREIRIDEIKKYDRIFFINAMIDLENDICIDIPSLLYL